MKTTIMRTIGLSALLLLAGCDQKPQTPPGASSNVRTSPAKESPAAPTAAEEGPSTPTASDPGDALAIVNGEPVTRMGFRAMLTDWRRERPDASVNSPQIQAQLFNEMINLVLLSQQAVAKGVDQSEQVKASLQWARTKVLAETMLAQRLRDNPVTEQDAKKSYDERYGSAPQKEYKARHILLKTEQEAQDVIDRLAKGADFAELAKKRSIGPSASKGGDLGWLSASDMVPPFAKAVAGMQKGGISATPVKTEFGWHVIRLEGIREAPPPSFDGVKDDILTELRQKVVNDYVMGLRKDAEIKPGVHPTTPKEVTKTEAAPAGGAPESEPKKPAAAGAQAGSKDTPEENRNAVPEGDSKD